VLRAPSPDMRADTLLESLQCSAPGEVALGLLARHLLLGFGPPRFQLLDKPLPLFRGLFVGLRAERPLQCLYAYYQLVMNPR
jgi:hypothetical protein